MLHPNMAFVPKVREVLLVFHPPTFTDENERRLNLLWPVHALHVYLDRTKDFRKGNQHLVIGVGS